MILPNQLTVLRIALTPAFFVLYVFGDFSYSLLMATIIFAIAALTDLYDGMVARRYGSVSRWGAFMDPLADKVLISAAFLALVHVQSFSSHLPILPSANPSPDWIFPK